MKHFFTILFFSSIVFNSFAQCPTMYGAIINACPGAPTAEGSNEWSIFKTGASAMNIADFRFAYGTPPNYTTMTINGSVAGVWTTQPGTLTLTAPGCTINVLTSGSVPANSNYVMIPSSTTLSTLNLAGACVGGNIYVLFFNTASSGVSGFSAAGVFANTPAAGSPRGFKITDVNSATCNGVFSTFDYTNGWSSNIDGNSVYFPGPSYANDGCITILPLPIQNFTAYKSNNQIITSWQMNDQNNLLSYEVERSIDMINFVSIHNIVVQGYNNYNYTDIYPINGISYYRLKIIKNNGEIFYSNFVKVNTKNKDLSITKNYANPATDFIQFEINYNKTAIGKLLLLDCNGKIVNNQILPLNNGITNEKIFLNNLQKGIYTMQIIVNNEYITEKIIKN